MTSQLDYYAILQIDPDADRDVIEAAYRKLAGSYRLDTSDAPDAETWMKVLNEAFEVLTDADKRADYDSLRRARDQVTGAHRDYYAVLEVDPVAAILVPRKIQLPDRRNLLP